jgi:hypothetical protein
MFLVLRLPYFVATLNEVQRMANVAATGVPHAALEQDGQIGGYAIPKVRRKFCYTQLSK